MSAPSNSTRATRPRATCLASGAAPSHRHPGLYPEPRPPPLLPLPPPSLSLSPSTLPLHSHLPLPQLSPLALTLDRYYEVAGLSWTMRKVVTAMLASPRRHTRPHPRPHLHPRLTLTSPSPHPHPHPHPHPQPRLTRTLPSNRSLPPSLPRHPRAPTRRPRSTSPPLRPPSQGSTSRTGATTAATAPPPRRAAALPALCARTSRVRPPVVG